MQYKFLFVVLRFFVWKNMASLKMGLGAQSCTNIQGRLPGVHSAVGRDHKSRGAQSMTEWGTQTGTQFSHIPAG